MKKACFIADILGIADMPFELYIRRKKLKHISAECDNCGDDSYIITLNKGMCRSLETEILGHEMVHLKQYLTGRLVDVSQSEGAGNYLWQGKPFVTGNTMDDYFLSPWELEARALEAWIAYRWSTR